MNVDDATGEDSFDEVSVWNQIVGLVGRLGRGLAEKALVAYFVALDPDTPPWARTSLLAALGYLGMPLDAIPDFTPVVGFTDDVAVLGAALAAVVTSIRPRHIRKARLTMRGWGIDVEIPDGDGPDDGLAVREAA